MKKRVRWLQGAETADVHSTNTASKWFDCVHLPALVAHPMRTRNNYCVLHVAKRRRTLSRMCTQRQRWWCAVRKGFHCSTPDACAVHLHSCCLCVNCAAVGMRAACKQWLTCLLLRCPMTLGTMCCHPPPRTAVLFLSWVRPLHHPG